MYDVTEVAHFTLGHIGCKIFKKKIGKKYVYIAIEVKTCCCQCVDFAVLRRQRGNEADFKVHFA